MLVIFASQCWQAEWNLRKTCIWFDWGQMLAICCTGSPVKGLLYVRGSVGGSVGSPEGVLSIRLYDGAVGPTRLSNAEAYLKVDERQQVTLKLEAVPSEMRGFLKVDGSLPAFQEVRGVHVLVGWLVVEQCRMWCKERKGFRTCRMTGQWLCVYPYRCTN